MLAFLGKALAPYALKIMAGLAIMGAVAAVLLGARQAGKTAARVEGLRKQLDNVEKRNAVDRDVGRASGADVRKRLRENWQRD